MSILYRVWQRTQTGAEVIAEVREDGTVPGPEAGIIREMLERYGYPGVSVEEALYTFRFTASTMIGVERVDPGERAQS